MRALVLNSDTRRLARALLPSYQRMKYTQIKRGEGLEFDQIREYQEGDDIRTIDWACTARSQKVLVRQYLEVKKRTVLIVLDVSLSGIYSSCSTSRFTFMVQLAGALALCAAYAHDSVGLMLFSSDITIMIPPRCSMATAYTILATLAAQVPQGSTCVRKPLEYLAAYTSPALVFFISDFIDDEDSTSMVPLIAAAARHAIVGIRYIDQFEHKLPSFGFIELEDIEQGTHAFIDLRKNTQLLQQKSLSLFHMNRAHWFKKARGELLELPCTPAHVSLLQKFFLAILRK